MVVVQEILFVIFLTMPFINVLLNAWFEGVLLPGNKLAFPFVFKSPNAGIFSETWLLQTGPVLCRGRPIIFTLKGVAFQDDLNKEKRDELEVPVMEITVCIEVPTPYSCTCIYKPQALLERGPLYINPFDVVVGVTKML